jgi:hypothetical protein
MDPVAAEFRGDGFFMYEDKKSIAPGTLRTTDTGCLAVGQMPREGAAEHRTSASRNRDFPELGKQLPILSLEHPAGLNKCSGTCIIDSVVNLACSLKSG